MPAISATTLCAALLFALFHVPVPLFSRGRLPRVLGIGYHLLMLPAVAALPAPEWARAAGFAWMLIDVVLNGAAYAGLRDEVADALRQGVHVLSAVWVAAAGISGPWWLETAGILLALAFLFRAALSGTRAQVPWLRHVNAALNVLWMIGVAAALWQPHQ